MGEQDVVTERTSNLGKRIASGFVAIFSTPLVAAIAFICAFVAGALLEFTADKILDWSPQGVRDTVLYWMTASFVALAIFLGVLFTICSQISDAGNWNKADRDHKLFKEKSDRLQEIQETISGQLDKVKKIVDAGHEIISISPPKHFSVSFQTYFSAAYPIFVAARNTGSRDSIVNAINAVVHYMVRLLEIWDEDRGDYRTSVMIYFPASKLQSIAHNWSHINMQFAREEGFSCVNDGILLQLPDLCTHYSIQDGRDEVVEAKLDPDAVVVSLPVAYSKEESLDSNNFDNYVRSSLSNLPGAPFALCVGFDWIPTRENIQDRCGSEPLWVREEITKYFSKGNMPYIQSFVCLGLRDAIGHEPRGVLNIVSNRTKVLDSAAKAQAYAALMVPFCSMLARLIDRLVTESAFNLEGDIADRLKEAYESGIGPVATG